MAQCDQWTSGASVSANRRKTRALSLSASSPSPHPPTDKQKISLGALSSKASSEFCKGSCTDRCDPRLRNSCVTPPDLPPLLGHYQSSGGDNITSGLTSQLDTLSRGVSLIDVITPVMPSSCRVDSSMELLQGRSDGVELVTWARSRRSVLVLKGPPAGPETANGGWNISRAVGPSAA
ncbi:hypothetical protein OPV22_023497 [Ensete ventricosum]|uniref:Uncharacterized protein n=1 Tax=Ensete ventricosum TaxID=4639 RepID=A0AAV8QUS8_ENSVE|nr:hypothetical protein OPV22_023497 [Ensete ventricosum]